MIVQLDYISCPILVSKFKEHELIKDKLLSSINSQNFSSVNYSNSYITRSDWNEAKHSRSEYMNILFPSLGYHMEEVYSYYGYKRINIHNCWFQQYTKGSGHMWHIHMDCQWTNVYYLEMPEDAPFLEVKDPLKNKISQVKVKEGDIISFPSFVMHRSPEITCDTRKTIISFNSCGDID